MAGIHLMQPEENNFGFTVGDLVLSYVWLERFLIEAASDTISKIVYVVFVPCKVSSFQFQGLLLFKMFTKNKTKSGYDHIYFTLYFQNSKDRTRIKSKFSRKEKVGDKSVTKGKEGLIACGEWKRIHKPDCQKYCGTMKNEYCAHCGGLYSGVFTNNNQIYAVPERVRRKKDKK